MTHQEDRPVRRRLSVLVPQELYQALLGRGLREGRTASDVASALLAQALKTLRETEDPADERGP